MLLNPEILLFHEAIMQDRNWDNLRVLLAVSRGGSFAEAGRRLGVDETTVGRRIATLSRSLGAELLEGPPGARRPTAAGAALVVAAETMERSLIGATRVVTEDRAALVGSVRLTAVPILINHVILPAISAFRATHPGVTIHLIASPEDLSVMGRDADIALRFGRPGTERDAVARRVATLRYAAYGRSEHLPWLSYGERLSGHPHASATDGIPDEKRAGLVVDDGETMARAILEGLGNGYLPEIVGDRAPDLQRTAEPETVVERPLWLILHPDGRHLARVRAVADWLGVLFRN